MNEISEEVDVRFRKQFLKISPAQRLAMACSMFSTAKALIQAGIPKKYNIRTSTQIKEYVFVRLYGQDFDDAEKRKILRSLS